MTTLYGISNCDTVRKARQWLDACGIEYTFHDFRKAGLDPALLGQWIDEVGLARLINRRGTTWRGLEAAERAQADTPQTALALILKYPSLIRRPVLQQAGQILIGFDQRHYEEVFGR